MIQAKFSITDAHLEFLSKHEQYGFRDKSHLVRAALDQLQSELLRRQATESADIYAEVNSKDNEIREWTDAALLDWPE
ncbi:MAG: hypothetical protein OXC26_08125 [Albidovulum sp.]|nr:hypothetical protein [Albidovulum sp.]